MSVWGVPLNPTVANAHERQAVELWHTHCVLQPTLWQVMLPFHGDTRVGYANVGCHHSGSLYHLLRSVIMPHSNLPLPLESLDCSPSPPSGGTADTLPYAVPGGRFTHRLTGSIGGGSPHLSTRLRVERCATGVARIVLESVPLSIAMPTLVSRACGGRCARFA